MPFGADAFLQLQSEKRIKPSRLPNRIFQHRPQQLLCADGKTLFNLWCIPHFTEVLHMFKTLDVLVRNLNSSRGPWIHFRVEWICFYSSCFHDLLGECSILTVSLSGLNLTFHQACAEALHHTLQIVSSLHDIIHYLISYCKLGHKEDSFRWRRGHDAAGSHLAADWGGAEGIGRTLNRRVVIVMLKDRLVIQ